MRQYRSLVADLALVRETEGNSVIDPSTEPPFNDRRQGEPDATWGDRPGIVASLLRYRVIVVAATLLGAVAGYALAQLLPVRYQADAVLILSDPGGPSILGGGNSLGTSDRQVYLAKQADIMTSRVVLERALQILGSDQSVRDVRDELDVHPAANMASISIAATTADPGSAAALANAVGTAYEQVTQERVAADAATGDREPRGAPEPLPGGPRRQPEVPGRRADVSSAAAGRPDRRPPAA